MNRCFFLKSVEKIRREAKVISCTFWRRPQYTQQVLGALSRCKGIENYLLLIQQDGADARGDAGQSEVRAICEKINFAQCKIVSESSHLGCNQNTKRALARGFRHSDYVIHMEDDVMFAPDALEYFEWARQFGGDSKLILASAWGYPPAWKPSSQYPKPPNQDHDVSSHAGLWIWGFATWEDRWKQMEGSWVLTSNDMEASWDCHLDTWVRQGRESLMPHTSRSQNIGEKDGVHRGAWWLEYWAGSPGFDHRGAFKRV